MMKVSSNIVYKMLLGLNALQVAFITMLIYFSSELIVKYQYAAEFIENANVIPINYVNIPLFGLLTFGLLVLFMHIQNEDKSIGYKSFFISIEIILCIFIMYLESFSSTTIILLLMANILGSNKNDRFQKVVISITIILYLLANSNIMFNFIQVTSLDSYLLFYTKQARMLFESINAMLSALIMICFIGYIILVIQNQIMESQHMKEMNRNLRELNANLEEMADMREKMGETKERNRLAREIHDTLGHTLTGLALGLDACGTLIDIDCDKAKLQIENLANIARAGLQDVRHSVNKLRPDSLMKHSLFEAFEEMIKNFEISTGVKVNFNCHLESLSFETDEEDTIYRIIQEGLTNALRHGQAKNIFVSFAKDEKNLIIIIEDDGIGSKNIKEGFGLHHMQERVNLLNGNVRWYSNNGFELIVEIPLRKA